MAPGDSAVIDLEVVNESKESYSLAISADVEEGDDRPLFEKLTIVIRGEEEKYSGPLSGLDKINLGSFAAESTRSLHMTLSLPVDAGNELQALAVSIKFQLYQVQDSEPPGSGGGYPPGSDVPSDPGQPGEPGDGDSEQPGEPGDGDSEQPGEIGQPEAPEDHPSRDTELPVTGTKVNLLLPLGLILFLIGLLILGSSKKEQKE